MFDHVRSSRPLNHLTRIHTHTLFCQASRPQISVNDGFKMQLALLELQLFGKTSVASPHCGREWQFYAWRAVRDQHPAADEPPQQAVCCTQS